MSDSPTLRSVLRRDIIAPCLVVFLCDIVWNVMSSTLTLYATGIGASISDIGLINSVTGLAMLLASVPVGVQSDRSGRKQVIMAGTFVFALACLAHWLAPSALWLLPGRALFAVGTVSTFAMTGAYIVDVTHPRERGLAFGLLTTAMGLGSTTGSLLASLLERVIGVPGSHLFAAAVALSACALAGLLLRKTNSAAPVARPRLPYATMLPLLRNPRIAFVCMVQLLMSTCFTGVVLPFFPLLAQAQGAASTTVSELFSLRSFGSMVTRLPFGILSNRVPRQRLLLIALSGVALMMIAMGRATLVPVLAIFMVIEGVAFGLNLTVGQAAVTENAKDDERGAAIGLNSMAGSLGSMLGPFLLGSLAAATSVPLVFQITGAGALLACWLAWWMLRRRQLVIPG